jgi:hypothetical protein
MPFVISSAKIMTEMDTDKIWLATILTFISLHFCMKFHKSQILTFWEKKFPLFLVCTANFHSLDANLQLH